MSAPAAPGGRPTHATVPGDIDPAKLLDLTPGKTYAIVGWGAGSSGELLQIIDDVGDKIGFAAEDSAHIGFRDWLLTTEPEAPPPPDVNAALLAALEGLLKHAGRDPEADDEAIAAYAAARAAIRHARGGA